MPDSSVRSLKALLRAADDCAQQQHTLEEKRQALLHEARTLQTRASEILVRFQAGECVVITNGRHYWWKDGELSRAAWFEEIDTLESMRDMGILEKVSKGGS